MCRESSGSREAPYGVSVAKRPIATSRRRATREAPSASTHLSPVDITQASQPSRTPNSRRREHVALSNPMKHNRIVLPAGNDETGAGGRASSTEGLSGSVAERYTSRTSGALPRFVASAGTRAVPAPVASGVRGDCAARTQRQRLAFSAPFAPPLLYALVASRHSRPRPRPRRVPPISSSGHLVLGEHLLGLDRPRRSGHHVRGLRPLRDVLSILTVYRRDRTSASWRWPRRPAEAALWVAARSTEARSSRARGDALTYDAPEGAAARCPRSVCRSTSSSRWSRPGSRYVFFEDPLEAAVLGPHARLCGRSS